jgi:choice-of-anchor B domain-containing protein
MTSVRSLAATLMGLLVLAALVPARPSFVHAQAGGTLTLLGEIDLSPSQIRNSDIWGWVDPNTSKEYAVVGEWTGTSIYIVDVSDPTNPVIASTITNTNGFDVKTWGNYVYGVDGNGSGNDGDIFDISNPNAPVFAGNFLSAHNIFIDANGIMYNSVNGLTILDVASNPTNPQILWSDGLTGGHDATAIGTRLYDFHGSTNTFIYEVGNPASPELIGQLPGNAGIFYHHQGWPSEDGRYLFVSDELGQSVTPDITVWDIIDPMTPMLVDSHTDPDATVHNCFVLGDFLYVSFYVAGVKVFDISDPTNMTLADEYDTAPAFTGNSVFEGCWGVYPFAPSGTIYASDMQNGLFLFNFTPNPTGIEDDTPNVSFTLEQNHPNPFNPTTTIAYHLSEGTHVTLTIYNAIGQVVRTLVDEAQSAGPQSVSWHGADDSNRPVASGVYYYKLRAGGSSDTKRMVLLK